MANNSKGELLINICGEDCILYFGWSAIKELQAEFGDDFELAIGDVSSKYKVDEIAKILVIGLEKYNPGFVTVEKIFESDPPLVPIILGIREALNCAFWGRKEGSEDEGPLANPKRRSLLQKLFGKLKKQHLDQD